VMMSQETAGLFGAPGLSDAGDISNLSDNIIVLEFFRREAQIQRTMMVLKTRASRHSPEVRQFEITSKGIVLGESPADLALR
jgi:circadian clock protein KaiC